MYYIIYDLKDNVIAYIDSFDELVKFTGCRKNNLKQNLKVHNIVYYHFKDTYRKIFAFEGGLLWIIYLILF